MSDFELCMHTCFDETDGRMELECRKIQLQQDGTSGQRAEVEIFEDEFGGGGVGTFISKSAILGARYLYHNHDLAGRLLASTMRATTVLELGSGTAILGVAAAQLLKAKNATFIFSEFKPYLNLINKNIEHNRAHLCSKECIVTEFTWGEESDEAAILAKSPNGCMDSIIAADCIYTEDSLPGLITSLRNLSTTQTEIFMINQHRAKHIDELFFETFSPHFEYSMLEIPPELIYAGETIQDIFALHAKKKTG